MQYMMFSHVTGESVVGTYVYSHKAVTSHKDKKNKVKLTTMENSMLNCEILEFSLCFLNNWAAVLCTQPSV